MLKGFSIFLLLPEVQAAGYDEKTMLPLEYNPVTMVFYLVEELKNI